MTLEDISAKLDSLSDIVGTLIAAIEYLNAGTVENYASTTVKRTLNDAKTELNSIGHTVHYPEKSKLTLFGRSKKTE